MKASVEIRKSFDDEVREFSKELESGDFKEFFNDEGGYLDRLSEIAKANGEAGDSFTVSYTVTVNV